jgi:NAD(P)-dependent dehydrogenase (short-subunit alcohol dehydrogenase family)
MKHLDEQIVLVTGATDGLGKALALTLAESGATVLLHGRDEVRLEAARQDILEAVPTANLATYRANFASLADVRRLGERLQKEQPRIDTLVNNAAVGGGKPGDPRREFSQDGYELRFAVNYLAPFLLTHLLLPCLRHTPPSRIINVSSAGQIPINFDDVMMERRYEPLDAYRQSKLAQVMFTFDLAAQVQDEGITVNCLHPASLMPTKMVHEYFGRTINTIEDGVNAVMRLAADPALDDVTGKYFDQTQEARANSQAYDVEVRRRLWRLSEALVGIQST